MSVVLTVCWFTGASNPFATLVRRAIQMSWLPEPPGRSLEKKSVSSSDVATGFASTVEGSLMLIPLTASGLPN